MKSRNIYKFLLGVVISILLIGFWLWGYHQPQSQTDTQQAEESAVILAEQPAETEIPLREETGQTPAPVVPTQTPVPTEEAEEPQVLLCNLSVLCDDVFRHLEDLKEGKQDLIPPGGVFFKGQNIAFSEGESVYDVLDRELKKKNISLQAVKNPIYKSVYIKGIGGLSEFDCGSSSGWMYRVNGENPTYGCSQYQVKPGDEIVFYYSCSY